MLDAQLVRAGERHIAVLDDMNSSHGYPPGLEFLRHLAHSSFARALIEQRVLYLNKTAVCSLVESIHSCSACSVSIDFNRESSLFPPESFFRGSAVDKEPLTLF